MKWPFRRGPATLKPKFGGRPILVCALERHIERLMQVRAERSGWDFVTTQDPGEVFELAMQHKPRYVILDVRKDLAEAIECQIREEPSLEQTEVVNIGKHRVIEKPDQGGNWPNFPGGPFRFA